jgi:hypothetical protein
MRRRRYLTLAAGAAAGLAGCAARAIPGSERPAEPDEPEGCPAELAFERTVCPGVDGPVSIEQSGETVSGDTWSLVVTATNESTDSVGVNPQAWAIYRQDGDRWEHVAPDVSIEPWIELRPDERYVWQLTAGAGGLADADHRVFLDIDPGTYAFAVPFRAATRLGAMVTFDVTD